MKLHRYVDHQRLHIVTKDVISLSISVLLLFRHYISHKITFGAPSSGGVLRSACGAFINTMYAENKGTHSGQRAEKASLLFILHEGCDLPQRHNKRCPAEPGFMVYEKKKCRSRAAGFRVTKPTN